MRGGPGGGIRFKKTDPLRYSRVDERRGTSFELQLEIQHAANRLCLWHPARRSRVQSRSLGSADQRFKSHKPLRLTLWRRRAGVGSGSVEPRRWIGARTGWRPVGSVEGLVGARSHDRGARKLACVPVVAFWGGSFGRRESVGAARHHPTPQYGFTTHDPVRAHMLLCIVTAPQSTQYVVLDLLLLPSTSHAMQFHHPRPQAKRAL
jgi:hypothetical protein